MPNPLHSTRIVLGVTGSIACYKAADLASKLSQAGAQVDTILTGAATKFLSPITFASVTGRGAYADGDLWGDRAHVLHISLGHEADLLIIAPITANTMAKLAHGTADDLLSVTALAARCPVLIAPAMDGGMFSHPATQSNLQILRDRGVHIIGPESGHLASGLVAAGRMSEPTAILGRARYILSRNGPLAGRHIVVTAGGTREPIDPVRYITNRSSGKQGYALAQAALDAGADVTLISAADLPAPAGATLINVGSVAEMAEAVLTASRGADALIMAAAVSDFRAAEAADQKIKKGGPGAELPLIRLAATTDILMAVASQRAAGEGPHLVVGFAAETQDLLDNARSKLVRKGLDLIVANDVSALDAGFGVDTNRVTLLSADGTVENLPLMGKSDVAERVIKWVVETPT